MQRGTIAQQVPDGACRTGLLIEGPIDDSRCPRPDHGTGAHRAGLESDYEGAAVEAPPSGRLGGIAQCHELGMPERILIDFASIVTAPDHRTLGVEDHGSDRNIVMLAGQGRLGEGECHPVLKMRVSAEAEFRALLR